MPSRPHRHRRRRRPVPFFYPRRTSERRSHRRWPTVSFALSGRQHAFVGRTPVNARERLCRPKVADAATSLVSTYLLNAAYDTVVRRRARNRYRPNEGSSLPTYRERVVIFFKKRLRCSTTPDLQSASIRNPFRSFIRPWVLNLRRFTHTVLGRNSRRAIRKTKVSNTTVVRRLMKYAYKNCPYDWPLGGFTENRTR